MKLVSSLAAAFLILAATGCSAPAETPTSAPVTPLPSITVTGKPIPASSAQCEEDEPCWDCLTQGNKICGPTPQGEKDALFAFSIAVPHPPAMNLKYAGYAATGFDLVNRSEYWTLPSGNPQIVYLFKVTED